MGGLSRAWAVKAIVVIIFSSILFRCVSATNHTVGGPTGWDLASDMQTWSSARTFFTGDNLVFSYGPTHDVLEVNGSDFAKCKTASPIGTYSDGADTVVQLTSPAGTRYFVCGTRGHCGLGLRVQVDVLDRLTGNATESGSGSSSNGTANGDDGDGQEQGIGGNHGRRHPPPSPRSPPPHHHHPPPTPDQTEGPCYHHQGSATATATATATRRVEIGMVGGLIYCSLHLITTVIFAS